MKRSFIYRIRFQTIPFFALNFVPKYIPAKDDDIRRLSEFICKFRKILVVTGAGISTESGIPDYRSEGVGLYARSSNRPVQYQDFVNSVDARKRYWARNFIAWPRFSSFQPNITHKTLSRWEFLEKVSCIVTQNVDRLHQKAGSKRVIELHGSGFEVGCLTCDKIISRDAFQTKLKNLNPSLCLEAAETIRPDGDVEISQEKIDNFELPSCESCGGVLKPSIVFFGDNVPKWRVDSVKREVSSSDGVLILGSSLSVFSSYRIILQAVEEKKSIAIVNIGPTRGDSHANLIINTKCGEILPRINV